jgi:hypothetical protein
MPTVQPFPAGGYRFISHQFQYSGGVAAEPGVRAIAQSGYFAKISSARLKALSFRHDETSRLTRLYGASRRLAWAPAGLTSAGLR